MGRNLPSLTLHVGCGLCKAQWGHMQLWAALLDPATCASLSEYCAYHKYWSVVRVWARQSAQWGDVPVCHGALDFKQNVNVSGRREVGCTSLPARRHFYTCCT